MDGAVARGRDAGLRDSLRHRGQRDGIATGWLPGELSARGRDLAVELGARRKAVDVVYASGLRRVVQTAEIAFAGSGKEIRLDRRLRECDYGIYNGRPVSEVAALRSRHIDTPWPGGQSYRQVVAEMAGFLREVMEEWQGVWCSWCRIPPIGGRCRICWMGLRWRSWLPRRSSGGRGGSTASPEVG
ncbi:histidine phosphatase family protein, partial [Nonomuraea angiospora]|uniref:histidine phosphatase family protein n=1 Tax=Nonomuraea angiospora TaxID=46172 RepID=UPI0038D4987B